MLENDKPEEGVWEIFFLIMPKWALASIFVISLANIYYSIGEILLNLSVNPIYLLILGLLSLILTLLLYLMQRKGEKQFIQIGKSSLK